MQCILWQQNTFALNCSSWQPERVYCWAAPADQSVHAGPGRRQQLGSASKEALLVPGEPSVELHRAPLEWGQRAPCSAFAQLSLLLAILPPLSTPVGF